MKRMKFDESSKFESNGITYLYLECSAHQRDFFFKSDRYNELREKNKNIKSFFSCVSHLLRPIESTPNNMAALQQENKAAVA
jgi:hypothetical protein